MIDMSDCSSPICNCTATNTHICLFVLIIFNYKIISSSTANSYSLSYNSHQQTADMMKAVGF